MEEKKKRQFTVGGCLGYGAWLAFASLPFIAASWLVYNIVEFFVEPNLLPRIIQWIEALGLCCAAIIIFLVAMSLYFKFFPTDEQPIDYY